MTEAGWTRDLVTAECIRDTLREQGNVLSPHVVAQCIDDLLKTATYDVGRRAGLEEAAAQIPTNWCNPLLSGETKAIIGPPFLCEDIEKLLHAIKQRLAQARDAKGVGDADTNVIS